MHEHKRCPECGSNDVEIVHTEFYQDAIERVKICNDCPCEFTVAYADPLVIDFEVCE